MRRAQPFSGPAAMTALALIFLPLTACRQASRSAAEWQQPPMSPIQAALAQCEFTKAVALTKDKTDPQARFYWGRMMAHGWGIQMDSFKAANFYKLAADQGYVRAKIFLAGVYLDDPYRIPGKGVVQAQQLFKEAADQGDVQGKYLYLALMHKRGIALTPDQQAQYKQAVMAAADAGDPIVSYLLAKDYSTITANGQATDPKLTLKYLLISAASKTQLPGSIAAGNLIDLGLKFGGDADEITRIVDYYASGNDNLVSLNYAQSCMQNRSLAICDPVKVITYGQSLVMGGKSIVDQTYLSSLTPSQITEGQRRARELKRHPLIIESPDFYVFPDFRQML